MSFKNNGNEIIIYEISNEEYIAIDIGYTAAYLMGDISHHAYNDSTFECKPYIVCHTETTHSKSYIRESEMLEKYGIQIISFKIAPPIENSFG